MVTLEPLFQGTTDGDQLFAIFEILGSLKDDEELVFQERVPYGKKLFAQFPRFTKVGIGAKHKRIAEIKDLLDLLGMLLEYLPEKRVTAEKALEHPYFSGLELP